MKGYKRTLNEILSSTGDYKNIEHFKYLKHNQVVSAEHSFRLDTIYHVSSMDAT